MLKQSKLFWAVLSGVTILLTLTAFTNQNSSASSANLISEKHQWLHISFLRAGGARTFTMQGAVTTAGTWAMQVTNTGQAFHCVNTLTSPRGTLVAISHCNNTTMNGVWHIVSGTGDFAGMKGNGSLVMTAGVGEEWDGTVK